MRLGCSNLLWTADLDPAAAALLAEHGIDSIDVAPTRYEDDIASAAPARWRELRRWWAQRGITITGLQSLLHGTRGLDIFGDPSVREQTAEHLRVNLRIAVELGATQLVFGSWRNRMRRSLDSKRALARAADFFGPLGEEAAVLGVCLGIEPISARYGNDFLVDHDEAAALVERVSSRGFGLVLDVGCAALAGEDVAAVAQRHAALVRHAQIAEFELAPLDPANPIHAVAGPALRAALAGRVASVEALAPPHMPALEAIAQSLAVAMRHYR
jgi:D-psicose/D-tagatose/L-ribulose 3-epimerase